MGSHRFSFIAVAIACIAAAGGGSYLATRHNVANVAAPTATASSPTAATEQALATPPEIAAAATPQLPPRTVSSTVVATATPSAGRETRRADRRQLARDTTPVADPLHANSERATIDRTATADTVSAAGIAPVEPLPSTSTSDATVIEPTRAPDPPSRRFDELVVSSESVIGLQMEGLITSDRARVEDRVEARVSRDVRVNGEAAIPAGTRALGNVVLVERGGRLRDRARLGIRFHTLQMADGTKLPISTETIYRLGDAPSNGSAAKIGGGAVAGAILGAIIGGGKGAAIGATTGAGAGTAVVMTGERSAAVFPAGADVTARILAPVTITVERE